MQSTAHLRSVLLGTALVAVSLLVTLASAAQSLGQPASKVSPARTSQLPRTPTTVLPQQPASSSDCQTPPCSATASAAPAASRPHRATITFADGQLTVAANDSSLHQILRSISVSTGMTINGGVAEQRVFGTYGPADPSTILSTLLDGTGVNMLLRDGPNHVPAELTLTQRSGGPTPAPITPQDDQIGIETPPPTQPQQRVIQPQSSQAAATQKDPSTSGPPSIAQPANNVLGNPNNTTPTASQIPTTNSVPVDALPTPSTTVQTQQGIVDTPNPPPAGSTAPTADSIYQQLLQLQKAKAAAAGSPTAPSTTPPPQ